MPELIQILQLPSCVRPFYCLPQLCCYVVETLAPFRCLKRPFNKGRIIFKCLSNGITDREAQELMEKLPQAKCLADYEAWTTRLDIIQGHEDWKEEKESIERQYDPDIIQKYVLEMLSALNSQDQEQIRLSLISSASRTFGGMDLLRLYKHTWFGTKQLIDDYMNTVRGTIEAYVDMLDRPSTSASELRKGIHALEHYLNLHGSTVICLSGGALFGMKHIGVVKCLWESYLLPSIICGASAGSIVASIVGCSTDDEMRRVLERFPNSHLKCFDSSTNLLAYVLHRVLTFARTRAFFDPRYLDRVMSDWLQDITFEEAYQKTGRTLNIAVSRIEDPRPTILNYMTTPDVVVRTAVRASCSVPLLFPSATILRKDRATKELCSWNTGNAGRYVDGSLDSDIPMQMLRERLNANYFIVSQVNPHVRWFINPEEKFEGLPVTTSRPPTSYWRLSKAVILKTLISVINFGENLPLLPWLPVWRWRTVLTQIYTGDANIYPAIDWSDYYRMMMNPTPEFMRRSTVLGEQATWPKMPRIKNCLAIEEALKKGIHDLNGRLRRGPGDSTDEKQAPNQQPARSRSPQPEFLKRRKLRASRPGLRRSSSIDGGSGTDGSALMRRNSSEPDLSMTRRGGRAQHSSSSRPVLSRQVGIGDGLFMTPIEAIGSSHEENN